MQPKDISLFQDYLQTLQVSMCEQLETLEGSQQFSIDIWERPEGGGGKTAILQKGNVFERVGVNYSFVFGKSLPKSATSLRSDLEGRSFQALGISSVIHPWNPYVPTAHMNVRMFVASSPNLPPIAWFGGGFDLTPYYFFEEDCVFWHHAAKKVCDAFHGSMYTRYKAWADRYFYLPHRNESRGVGGLFFDDLNEQTWGISWTACQQFTQAVGNTFLKAYLPIVSQRKDTLYGAREREFQKIRRGRYVEFNLLHDRGTLFGIQSGGRTESILMSMPPDVSWHYNYDLEENSNEANLLSAINSSQNWAEKPISATYLKQLAIELA